MKWKKYTKIVLTAVLHFPNLFYHLWCGVHSQTIGFQHLHSFVSWRLIMLIVLFCKGSFYKCKYFEQKCYWMFTHNDDTSCKESNLGQLTGPIMTDDLSVVYPCNRGKCSINCTCESCQNTKRNICHLKNHKKHSRHSSWKEFIFSQQKLIDQPRSIAVDVIKFSGIKKSCKICRQNVKNHFEKHLEFHLQCKLCLFQLASMEDERKFMK